MFSCFRWLCLVVGSCLLSVLVIRMSLQELTDYGQGLGLKGDALHKFILDQQAKDRDERAAEREKEQREREYELEKSRLQNEAAKLREEHDQQLRLKELENMHELKLLEAGGSTKAAVSVYNPAKAPKMPVFNEGKDDIDAYLRRFERYAEAQGWVSDNWATNLSALLQGRALDVYALLPFDKAKDYDELKSALLKRFELTEDGFRQKFRGCRPENGETFQQFAVRMGSYFDRWIEMSKVKPTYDGLYDLMLRDQFLSICNRDLLLFLKERIPETLADMSRLADQYREARRVSAVSLMNPHRKGSPTSAMPGKGPNQKPSSSEGQSKLPTSTQSRPPFMKKDVKCYKCGELGHVKSECLSKKGRQSVAAIQHESGDRNVNATPNISSACIGSTQTVTFSTAGSHSQLSASCDVSNNDYRLPVCRGRIGDREVTVLRDTGCTGVVVKRSLVTDAELTQRVEDCTMADGSFGSAPVAKVSIDTPYFAGEVEAWCLAKPVFDLILGNIANVRAPNNPDPDWQFVQAVKTRSQVRAENKPVVPLKVAKFIPADVTPDEIISAQRDDETLSKVRALADVNTEEIPGKAKFYYKNSLLFRRFQSQNVDNGRVYTQLVVPKPHRLKVMQLAHESLLSGHLGTERTLGKILCEFFWPGVHADVRRFCQSCDVCQRTTSKGKTRKVPLAKMPIIDEPFRRVAVDLVGPLHPPTERGNRYILTLVDFATRYPEAVALKGIETETVAEALVDIFCRVGVPKEMLTDMGAQFTSTLMSEVSRLISIKQLSTTPYHPMCNGLVERFNGVLKQILKRLCSERPKDWDKYLGAVLFAYRDVTQESLGFSPFELVYGRQVRGPMCILRELWTKDIADSEVKTTYQYIVDLRERLETTSQMARDNLEAASSRYKKYYNKKAKDRDMKVGEKVLVLLPTSSNKLLMQWKGPYEIVAKLGKVDYKIDMQGKVKTFHANMLKRYIDRAEFNLSNAKGVLGVVSVAVVDIEHETSDLVNDSIIDNPKTRSSEGPSDIHIDTNLEYGQRQEIDSLLHEFADVLSDIPGRTNLGEHSISLTSSNPIRTKQYPLPFAMQEVVCDEVRNMLDMGIIEPSVSPYSSPVVLIKKKDGTVRFCIDFRAINKVTVFDAETIPNADEIFVKLAGCKYISKFDLCKGYWQLPLAEQAKEITAFQTPLGLFQFSVMPFGLTNASASFSRIMRVLLRGMHNVDNFIDDIIIFTRSFPEHVQAVRELLIRLRNAKLAAKPSKCFIAYKSLECLGHMVGNEQLRPVDEKVEAIRKFERPDTKKQVKSFLGLVVFYRRFIPNFSAIASPLTDLTRKG